MLGVPRGAYRRTASGGRKLGAMTFLSTATSRRASAVKTGANVATMRRRAWRCVGAAPVQENWQGCTCGNVGCSLWCLQALSFGWPRARCKDASQCACRIGQAILRQNSVTIVRSVSPQLRLVWRKPVGLRVGSWQVSTLVRQALRNSTFVWAPSVGLVLTLGTTEWCTNFFNAQIKCFGEKDVMNEIKK